MTDSERFTARRWLELEAQRYAVNMGFESLRLDQLDVAAVAVIEIALHAGADLDTLRRHIQTAILTTVNPAAVGM